MELSLKPTQINCINVLQENINTRRLNIHMFMRLGKTACILHHINNNIDIYSNILWIVFESLEPKQVHDEISLWKLDAIKDKIVFTTKRSLHKHNLNQYSLIIFNEVHTITQPVYDQIVKQNPTKIISMTGSYPVKGIKLELLNKLNLISYYTDLTPDTQFKISIVEVEMNTLVPSYDIKYTSDGQEKIFRVTEFDAYKYQKQKLDVLESKYSVHIIRKEQINLEISSFKPFKEESYENKGRLIRLYTESKAIRNILNQYYSEKGDLLLQLNILLNNFSSSYEYAKKVLYKYPNDRILIFSNTHENSQKLFYSEKYIYNSKTDKKWLKSFNDKESNRLILLQTGSTGYNYFDVDRTILLNINSSTSLMQKLFRGVLKSTSRGNKPVELIVPIYKDTIQKKWIEEALINFKESINYISEKVF